MFPLAFRGQVRFVSEAAPATSAEVDALAEKLDLRLERLNAAWQGPGMDGRMGYHAGPRFGEKLGETIHLDEAKKPRVIGQLGVPILSGLNGLTHNRFQF